VLFADFHKVEEPVAPIKIHNQSSRLARLPLTWQAIIVYVQIKTEIAELAFVEMCS